MELVGIPLDGPTDEINRRFRRFSSVAEQDQILAALDRVDAAVCVNTVVHKGNFTALAGIAGVIDRHPSVREWQLFQFMPIGPLGHRNRARFEIPETDFSAAIDQLGKIVPPSIKLTPKEARSRKNCYLLIDSAGVAWVPYQDGIDAWPDADTNGNRITIGHISDPAIIDRIADLSHLINTLLKP